MKSLYSSSYDTKRLRGSFSLGDFRWLRFKVNAMSTHIALKFSHKSVKQQHPKGNSCSKPIFHDLPRAACSKVRVNCHKQNTIRNIEKKRSQKNDLGPSMRPRACAEITEHQHHHYSKSRAEFRTKENTYSL